MKNIETKKVIALAIVGTICLLAIVQGVVAAMAGDFEQIVNASVITMGSTIVGFYFGYGKGQSDGGDSNG